MVAGRPSSKLDRESAGSVRREKTFPPGGRSAVAGSCFAECQICPIDWTLLFILLGDKRPGFVRVEAFHLLEFVQGFRPKVFLVNHSVMTDDEGPHSSNVILSRCSDQGKAANHDTLHDEVHFAEWRRRALPLQDFKEIAMVRLRAAGVALLNRSGDIFAYRAR